MNITKFHSTDSPQVAALFREIFKENGWEERPSDHMNEPTLLFHLPDNGLLLVVKENDEIVGTAGVINLSKTEGLMKRFYLSKSLRGTGIASQLLSELEKNASTIGLSKLILDVSKNNARAVHFYEKSGFVKTSVTPREDWPESQLPQTHYYFYKILK